LIRGGGRRPIRRGRGGGGRKLKYKLQKKERMEARAAREAALANENVLFLSDAVSVSDLAAMMGKEPIDMIKKLMELGTMASMNQSIDFDVAASLAAEYEYEVRNPEAAEEVTSDGSEAAEEEVVEEEEGLVPRPPVITVMGHVDHGKTSILDRLRKTAVVDGEAGGITQHIGAYQVVTEAGNRLTFIDTPGHAAFTAMRAQGAQVTDLTVLVVAADDGVMPQTKEAIHHARAAGCPILVAMNKIDLPGKDEQKILQELASENLVPEAWGGDTTVVGVSAKTGEGFPELIEMIGLQTEMLELKANPDGPPQGTVLESRMEKGLGGVATVLIRKGTLKKGMSFIAGTATGRARILKDWDGNVVKSAPPGTPVEVVGWHDVPDVNSQFQFCESDAAARSLRITRLDNLKKQVAEGTSPRNKHSSLEDLFASLGKAEKKDLNFVIKSDVHGSAIALADSLLKLSNEEVDVKVVYSGVGAPNESDVMLAAASEAIVVGFHVRPPGSIRKLAEKQGVQIKSYRVIYECVEEVEKAIKGMLKPVFEEVVVGSAEVRMVISVPKLGKIAGSYVTEGKIPRNAGARLLRDGVELWEGKLASLRRFKDDVKEVAQGFECGIGLADYSDIKEADVIEVFEQREINR
jgi:translation initiation factor IF-2